MKGSASKVRQTRRLYLKRKKNYSFCSFVGVNKNDQ